MAIVPPGNKQIGTFQITGVVDEGESVGIVSAASYSVLKNSTVTFTGQEAQTVQVGSFQFTGVVDEGDSIGITSAGFYAVVQKFDIRRESVIHSLYYGKNNQFLR